MMGGNANLTNSDFVQIAKADELIKPDSYAQWESQRGGDYNYPFGPQQQYSMPQQQAMQQPPPQIPQINIKMVGGNDFSKGPEGKGPDGKGTDGTVGYGSSDAGISITGGSSDAGAFNNLVIPSMKGGDSSFKKEDTSILGGLADFGNLVINKIM
jgi:hypothetical protein